MRDNLFNPHNVECLKIHIKWKIKANDRAISMEKNSNREEEREGEAEEKGRKGEKKKIDITKQIVAQ